jgi:hypothetical protein
VVAEDFRGLSAVEFLRDFLGIAVIGGIIAAVLSTALLLLVRDHHRKAEEMRLLQAFMTLTNGELNPYASESEAAKRANIHDYGPVVDRLERRGDIVRPTGQARSFVPPGSFVITPEGRERLSERPWWRRMWR